MHPDVMKKQLSGQIEIFSAIPTLYSRVGTPYTPKTHVPKQIITLIVYLKCHPRAEQLLEEFQKVQALGSSLSGCCVVWLGTCS